jgi:hypothetical protein
LQASLSTTNGQPHFAFWTMAGQTYDIYYSFQLASPSWQFLQRITNAPGGLVNVPVLPNPTAPTCFVRVQWIRN